MIKLAKNTLKEAKEKQEKLDKTMKEIQFNSCIENADDYYLAEWNRKEV